MPLIDIRCLTCDTVSEVFRHHTDYPKTPSCPKCDAPTEQIQLPKSVRSYAPAVVVFKAPDGSFRYPGNPNGQSAANYEKMGYTRCEAKGWAEVRSLEKKLNAHESGVMARSVERQRERYEAATRQRRSEVYEGMKNGFMVPEIDERTHRATGRMKVVKLSPVGRAVMQAAMSNNDRKPGPQMHEPGTFVEAYSYDRSNREDSRDAQGRRHRD